MNLRQLIQHNASRIRHLHQRVHNTYEERDRGPEQLDAWKAACSQFHDEYSELAFPGGTHTARDRVRSGDREAIEYAITFLEERPYFFRSGYMYQDFMRVLKNCPLLESHQKRYDRIRNKYLRYRNAHRKAQSADHKSLSDDQ